MVEPSKNVDSTETETPAVPKPDVTTHTIHDILNYLLDKVTELEDRYLHRNSPADAGPDISLDLSSGDSVNEDNQDNPKN